VGGAASRELTGCAAKHRLHLPKLHTHAINLDLTVDATKILEVAIRAPAYQVTCNAGGARWKAVNNTALGVGVRALLAQK
jgi:hypothetical protein